VTVVQPATEVHEIHPKSVARSILEGILLVAYFLLSIALIVCVTFTNTKNEGLTGIIGGGSTASPVFKGKKSAEETLAHWTARLSWAFLFSSLGIWLFMSAG
jgi:protein translocase SecG subunit